MKKIDKIEQKIDIQNVLFNVIMNDENGRKQCEEIMEILNKYTFPTKKSSDGYYHINLPSNTTKSGRTQLKAKTLPELEAKVLQRYLGLKSTSKKTFADVFKLLQEEKTKYITDPEKLFSVQNTISKNYSEFTRFFERKKTDFAEMNIEEITPKNIEDIFYYNVKEYKLRPKGIASLKALLRQTFDYAFKKNLIRENPFLRVDFEKFRYMASNSVPIEQRAYTDDDLKKFLDYLHDKQQKQKNYLPAYALELQILTGLRRGEIPPLRWSDVTADYIHIHQEQLTIKKHGDISEHLEIVNHTKTHKNRKYPMSDDLKDLLNRLKSVHDRYYPDSVYLFPAKTDNGVISNYIVYNFYRRMLKSLGYQQTDGVILGTHSFRRNAITRTVNASNGNLVLAAEMFGNSPEVIRNNYYTGLNIEDAKTVVNKVRLL